MTNTTPPAAREWDVSLHARVLARLQLTPLFGGNVDLAADNALAAPHDGTWHGVRSGALALFVDNEEALHNVRVVSCRPHAGHDWDIVLEGYVGLRRIVQVEADSAHEARTIALLRSHEGRWQVYPQTPGAAPAPAEAEIADAAILEHVEATSVR